MKLNRSIFRGLIAVVIFFILLWVAQQSLNKYVVFIIDLIGVYILMVLSLNLTNGYTGLFNLGHAGFMAVGAYTSVLLTFPAAARKFAALPYLPSWLGGPNYQWPFLPALLMGGILAAILAIPVGIPALRLRGHYFAVMTLGFMVIVETIAINARGLTRGALGINAIPTYTNLFWTYGWVIIFLYINIMLMRSSYGRAMLAIREDEIAAQAMGVNLTKYKMIPFVLSAFFQGIAGGLFAHLTTNISPYDFSFDLTFTTVIMLIVGGSGTMTGAILGTSILTALSFALKPIEEGLRLYGLIELIYSALLILVMIKWPLGMSGGNEWTFDYIARKLRLKKEDRIEAVSLET